MFHLAVMYGRFAMASALLDAGDDPRYPFVYDPGFKFTQSIKKRRKIIQTVDLIESIKLPGTADLLRKVRTATESLERLNRAKRTTARTSHTDQVSKWTSHLYQTIQKKRRGPLPLGFRKRARAMVEHLKTAFQKSYGYHLTSDINWRGQSNKAETVNQALAKHMSNHALRVPQLPRHFYWRRNNTSTLGHTNAPRILLRGVHGPIARILRKQGFFKDHGYIATTIDERIAERFRNKNGMLLIFPIRDLPKGTPWIWFTPKPTKQSNLTPSVIAESEVLLPPGTIRLLQKYGTYSWYASYEPDREARSLKGRKIIRS